MNPIALSEFLTAVGLDLAEAPIMGFTTPSPDEVHIRVALSAEVGLPVNDLIVSRVDPQQVSAFVLAADVQTRDSARYLALVLKLAPAGATLVSEDVSCRIFSFLPKMCRRRSPSSSP